MSGDGACKSPGVFMLLGLPFPDLEHDPDLTAALPRSLGMEQLLSPEGIAATVARIDRGPTLVEVGQIRAEEKTLRAVSAATGARLAELDREAVRLEGEGDALDHELAVVALGGDVFVAQAPAVVAAQARASGLRAALEARAAEVSAARASGGGTDEVVARLGAVAVSLATARAEVDGARSQAKDAFGALSAGATNGRRRRDAAVEARACVVARREPVAQLASWCQLRVAGHLGVTMSAGVALGGETPAFGRQLVATGTLELLADLLADRFWFAQPAARDELVRWVCAALEMSAQASFPALACPDGDGGDAGWVAAYLAQAQRLQQPGGLPGMLMSEGSAAALFGLGLVSLALSHHTRDEDHSSLHVMDAYALMHLGAVKLAVDGGGDELSDYIESLRQAIDIKVATGHHQELSSAVLERGPRFLEGTLELEATVLHRGPALTLDGRPADVRRYLAGYDAAANAVLRALYGR